MQISSLRFISALAVPLLPVGQHALRAQQLLIVDASGGTPYSSINAALIPYRKGDEIHVCAGIYREAIVLDNRAVTILGVDPNPASVVVQPPNVGAGIATAGARSSSSRSRARTAGDSNGTRGRSR